MKRPSSRDDDIVEQIVISLGRPLRRPEKDAKLAVQVAIGMARQVSLPDAVAIRKLARDLSNALKPFRFNIPIEGCERNVMTMAELKSVLDFLQHIAGPSRKVDLTKRMCAELADGLVNNFSPDPPTGTPNGRYQEVAGLLHKAVNGKMATLKRQRDAVRESWRGLEDRRGR